MSRKNRVSTQAQLSCTRVVHLLHQHVLITHSPHMTSGFTPSVVHSVGLGKGVMCIHHYTTTHTEEFHRPAHPVFLLFISVFSLNPWQPPYCLHGFASSRTAYSWDHTACSHLFFLSFFFFTPILNPKELKDYLFKRKSSCMCIHEFFSRHIPTKS